jgi:hypothetical protein
MEDIFPPPPSALNASKLEWLTFRVLPPAPSCAMKREIFESKI